MPGPKYPPSTVSSYYPSRSGAAVTPSDTVDLAYQSRLFVGVAGNVACILADDGETSIVFKGVSGFLPLVVKRVLSTGTTATDIVALY